MNADEKALRELHAQWIAAVNAGDLPRLLGWITDDVVLLSPGREPSGREGFEAGFTAAHHALSLRCTSDIEELEVIGDRAWTRCRDRLSLAPREGGPTTELAGHRLTIYRRGDDGRWRLARDAHTLAPVAES